jgi:hypothetical protein
MAKKEMKRRYLTLELNPRMTDEQEKRFKESIEEVIRGLKHKDSKGLLVIPKVALRIDDDSGIVVVKNQLIKP